VTAAGCDQPGLRPDGRAGLRGWEPDPGCLRASASSSGWPYSGNSAPWDP